jgi:hypothetical protein
MHASTAIRNLANDAKMVDPLVAAGTIGLLVSLAQRSSNPSAQAAALTSAVTLMANAGVPERLTVDLLHSLLVLVRIWIDF